MTRVVHCRKEKFDIYIGRPSVWGNPYIIDKDGDREEVVRKYKEWILGNSLLLSRLHELKDKTLGCYCKPLACHGDVLVELIDKL